MVISRSWLFVGLCIINPFLSSDVLWPLCQIWQQPHPEPRESQEAVLPVASPRAVGSCRSTDHPHPAWCHAGKLHCPQALGLRLFTSITEQDNRTVKTSRLYRCDDLISCNTSHFYVVHISWMHLPVSGGVGCLFRVRHPSWSWRPLGMWCWSPSPSADREMEQSSKLTSKPSQKQVCVLSPVLHILCDMFIFVLELFISTY